MLGTNLGGVVRKVSVLLAALLISGIVSCGKKNDDCAQKLAEKIQVGTSQSDAEQLLDQCGFTYSFDQRTSMIYALKRGDKGGIVRQDWSAKVKLDEGRKVASVNVEKVFTGP
jgi:hypothetical protein